MKRISIISFIIFISLTPLFAQEKEMILDVKGPGGKSITAYDRVSDRSFGGYLGTEYYSNVSTANFRSHSMVLQSSAKLHERLLFNAEIEYEYGAQFPGRGEIKIEQAWVDYVFSEAFVQRTGIVVVPFGRLNVLHDSDVRDLTNRPIHAKRIVPTTWMDTGIGAYGVLDFDDIQLTYEGYLINGLTDLAISNVNGLRTARPTLKEDNNRQKALVARLGVSPFLGLEIGASYYTGKIDDEAKKGLSMLGLDGFYKTGPFELVGEYARNTIDELTNITPQKMNGFYLEGRYHISGDWLKNSIFGKGFRNPVITFIARYGQVDTNEKVKDRFDVKQATIGVNFRPVETLVYKLDYEMNREAVDEFDNDTFWASVAIGF